MQQQFSKQFFISRFLFIDQLELLVLSFVDKKLQKSQLEVYSFSQKKDKQEGKARLELANNSFYSADKLIST